MKNEDKRHTQALGTFRVVVGVSQAQVSLGDLLKLGRSLRVALNGKISVKVAPVRELQDGKGERGLDVMHMGGQNDTGTEQRKASYCCTNGTVRKNV